VGQQLANFAKDIRLVRYSCFNF